MSCVRSVHSTLQRYTDSHCVQVLRIGRNQKTSAAEQNKVLSDVCPTGVQVDNNSAFVDHPGCVHCGRCVSADPKQFRQEIAPL